MEEQERTVLLKQLVVSRDRLLELVAKLTPEQWAFRPAEGKWSIGECIEHIMRVENRMMGLIGNKVSEGAPDPEKRDPAHAKDALIAQIVPDRSARREAPEPARPIGQYPDPNELLAAFRKTRERTSLFAATTQVDLRGYFHPHMALGELDCYQWLLVLSLHGSRHAQQIEEIKATQGFPGTDI
jgi:hypothetical protein